MSHAPASSVSKSAHASQAAETTGVLQRKCACDGKGTCKECQESAIKRKSNGAAQGVSRIPASVRSVLGSSGRVMDGSTRDFMESRFDHDFGSVRIHTDDRAAHSARSVHAAAYTSGQHVVFADGQYAPASRTGMRLLAHELAHVVQNRGVQGSAPARISSPGDRDEREADAAENAIETSRPIDIAGRARPGMVSRFVPAEAEAEFEADFEVEDDIEEDDFNGETVESDHHARTRGQGSHRTPPIGSLPWQMHQNRLQGQKDRAEWQVSLTMDHGGKSPDFVTTGAEVEGASAAGNFKYRPQTFHVLSALEYDVERSTSKTDLMSVFHAYIADAPADSYSPFAPQPAFQPLITQRSTASNLDSMDPGAKLRYGSFATGLLNLAKKDPASKELVESFLGKKLDGDAKPDPKPKPKTTVDPKAEPDAKEKNKTSDKPAPANDDKGAGLYPLCWSALLPPPGQRIFARVEKEERDQGEQQNARIQAEGRAQLDPDFNPSKYHVHHITPLFLGGDDNLKTNGILWPARTHLRGHADLNYQPQLENPPAPLKPLSPWLYKNPIGTKYVLLDFKGNGGCPKGADDKIGSDAGAQKS